MIIDADAHALQPFAIGHGAGLAVVVRDHHAAHQKTALNEDIAQTQDIFVIRDAQVAPDLVFLNVNCTDDNDDFCVVLQLREHTQLAVGLESRQHTTGMEIVIQLPAKFQIKLVAELRYALLDGL